MFIGPDLLSREQRYLTMIKRNLTPRMRAVKRMKLKKDLDNLESLKRFGRSTSKSDKSINELLLLSPPDVKTRPF